MALHLRTAPQPECPHRPMERPDVRRAGRRTRHPRPCHRRRRRLHRGSRRDVRHRRRRRHRPRALRGVPRARRLRGDTHAALHRHLARDHRPHHLSVLLHPPRRGHRPPRCGAAVDDPRHRRGRHRRRARGRCAGVAIQGRVRGHRWSDCRQAPVRRRALAAGQEPSRPRADAVLRLSGRAVLVADGRERVARSPT